MLSYAVKLTPDTNGTLLVICPDIPEVTTFGEDRDEALDYAVDAIVMVLSMYIDTRRDIPKPSASRRGGYLVSLPALVEAKIALYKTMRAKRIGKAELARRLNVHLPQIDRLLDLSHNSRLDQLEGAFRALGKRVEIRIGNAA